MSVARKRRRYLRWARYVNRIRKFDNSDVESDWLNAVAIPWGFARAQEPFYCNWANSPYGWTPYR